MKNEIEQRLVFLEESRHSHYNIIQAMNVSEGFTILDMFIWVVLKRSISLAYGFTTLIRASNLICAAPLVRLQIDNLLRYHAAFLVNNQEEFVVEFFSGTPIRKMRDRNGNLMRDVYLQQEVSKRFSWLEDVYQRTSGYVHLSEQHMFNTIRASGKGEGAIEGYIGPDDKLVSDEVYEDAVETMILVTHSLLTDVADWVTKGRHVEDD
jgi:hypothetical protein